MRIEDATFVTSAARLADLPPDDGVEIAFVGRSNAGKSSLINALAQRNRLAYVSKTPGRTQLINFFSIANKARLVDLPGYGYAKVPLEEKRRWHALIEGYLAARTSLAAMVLVMDARHPLKPLDLQLIEWAAAAQVPVLPVLTKADKLSRADQALTLRKARSLLMQFAAAYEAMLVSAEHAQGIAALRERLIEVFENQGKKNPSNND